MKYKFEITCENVLDKIIQSYPSKEFIFNDEKYELVLLEKEKMPFAKFIFHKIFTIMLSTSGDVYFYKIEPEIFYENTILIIVTSYRNLYIGLMRSFEGNLKYIIKSSSARLFALVQYEERRIYDAIYGAPNEDEIVRAAVTASRLAKSLCRTGIPIIDIETGKIIDFEIINYEETLFIEIFRALMREYDRKRWSRVEP
ncbi:MAG: hypothetical protein QXQ37_00730 [Nitrososphaerota archaeon]